jgi:hypothetical protein
MSIGVELERPGTGPVPAVCREVREGGVVNVVGTLDRFAPAPEQLVAVVLDDTLAHLDVAPGTELLVDPRAPVSGRPVLVAVAGVPGGYGVRPAPVAGERVVGPVVAVRRGWAPD